MVVSAARSLFSWGKLAALACVPLLVGCPQILGFEEAGPIDQTGSGGNPSTGSSDNTTSNSSSSGMGAASNSSTTASSSTSSNTSTTTTTGPGPGSGGSGVGGSMGVGGGGPCGAPATVATGSPGLVDDFEGPALTQSKNPSAYDGISGYWTWYPDPHMMLDATIEADPADANNKVVRFKASTDLMDYAGLDFGMLTDGKSYDASVYSGIEFRIRGVAGTGKQIDFNVITAETQFVMYGGCLTPQGGHFHKVITLAESNKWYTIQVAWGDLQVPEWGGSMGLTQFAVSKIRALSWQITKDQGAFDVFIDDIKLYK